MELRQAIIYYIVALSHKRQTLLQSAAGMFSLKNPCRICRVFCLL